MPEPKIGLSEWTVSDPEKMGAYSVIFPVMLDVLQSYHPETPITADDIVDFCALMIASLHEHDSHITSPKHRRMATETAAAFVTRWYKSLRDQREAGGEGAPSFLDEIMAADETERAKRKAH
ncbi:hypothetical protein [Sphingomonas sp. G-3-2-10]|uniref:hypothetical protein n=1 Tax=Sphingomonas sp. G-3-2-10 TaxID=2728838 RepID=UPI00146C78AB|nr:hypothetical protein [Sphingomonas sp. G-3-2-10]NML04260.1 hypothetical protein [Sphingomonas sp. G-3-2-10]